MASPTVTIIGETRAEVWPVVSRIVAGRTQHIAEMAGLDEAAIASVEELAQRYDDGRSRRREICSETIWTMARMGRLRTRGEAELVAAVRAFFDTDPNDDAACAAAEDALYKAFQALPDHDFKEMKP